MNLRTPFAPAADRIRRPSLFYQPNKVLSPVLLARHYRPTTDLTHEPAKRLLSGDVFACETLANETKLQKIWQGPGCSYSYELPSGPQVAGYTDGGPTLKEAKPNEDAMALGISGNEIISIVADGVGSHDQPAITSKLAASHVLTSTLAGTALKPSLVDVTQILRTTFLQQEDSSTTLTASRFWETEGAWHFQHAGIGNSDSLLLARTHPDAPWSLISQTDEHTFPAELRKITLVLAQPAENSPAQKEKKIRNFNFWRANMASYEYYRQEREYPHMLQLCRLIAEADHAIASSEAFVLDEHHPQMNRWIKAGLFVFTDAQKRAHPAASLLTEALGPNTPNSSLPEFSKPILLHSGMTYLELKTSDGFSDIFDLNETLALLHGISSAQDAVTLLAGAAFLAMDDHIKTRRLISQLRRATDGLDLSTNERFTALDQLKRRLSKLDNLTIQAVLLRP